MDDKKLYVKIPTQGWEQFLTGRNAMLAAYDIARDQADCRQVKTLHGNVAEASLRKWLEGFLPKKYGVTSGYIVSAGRSSSETLPHFDIIIYDCLESPVLWIEANPDNSREGSARAIPVEYVKAVLESQILQEDSRRGSRPPIRTFPVDGRQRWPA